MERIGALGAAQRRGGAAEAWVREDVILRAAPGCGCGELCAPVDADARCEGAGAAGRPTPHFLSSAERTEIAIWEAVFYFFIIFGHSPTLYLRVHSYVTPLPPRAL